MGHIIEVNNLSVNYGVVPALDSISFDIDEGEVVAIIGPNGAGKTTTMHTISGLLKPKSGSILYCGEEIGGKEAHKLVQKGIAQVPEGRGIFPILTVEENLTLGAYLRKDKAGVKKDMEWIYSLFPRLGERKTQVGGTLSGGEQQMLAMGRALMAKPKVLLLDEPSMGLAPVIVEEIFKIIKKINKENHTTILIVEQNAQMALTVSHKAYVMEVGHIVNSGLSKDLKKDDNIQKAYLGI